MGLPAERPAGSAYPPYPHATPGSTEENENNRWKTEQAAIVRGKILGRRIGISLLVGLLSLSYLILVFL